MSFGVQLNKNNSIYGATPSPFMSNSFEDNFSFNLPFSGMDFMQYMNNDFMSTFQFFNMLMMNQMPKTWQGQIFNKDFNTKTNLASLKNVYNPSIGNKLANIANTNARSMNSKGYCARGTNKSLELAGLANGETRVGSAFQAKDVLSHHKNFKEVAVAKDDLKNLPAGCVIVWQPFSGKNGKFHQHGHIAVTLGNGQEASDHVQNLVMGNQYSVYVPVGMNHNG